MHGLRAGVYDGRRYDDRSHGVQSMRYVQCRIRRHDGDGRQQRMHHMRRGLLQSDCEQRGMHGVHDGVYDDRWHDGSHGSESVRYV